MIMNTPPTKSCKAKIEFRPSNQKRQTPVILFATKRDKNPVILFSMRLPSGVKLITNNKKRRSNKKSLGRLERHDRLSICTMSEEKTTNTSISGKFCSSNGLLSLLSYSMLCVESWCLTQVRLYPPPVTFCLCTLMLVIWFIKLKTKDI